MASRKPPSKARGSRKREQTPSAPPAPVVDTTTPGGEPCPLCMELYEDRRIRQETVQPVKRGAFSGSVSRRFRGLKICRLCAAAEGLADRGLGMTFEMARIAVGNEFQEAIRMPRGMSKTYGLRVCGDLSVENLEAHLAWVERTVPDLDEADEVGA